MKESNEGVFVVNHIKLNRKINDKMMNKIAAGGFANIYVTEI